MTIPTRKKFTCLFNLANNLIVDLKEVLKIAERAPATGIKGAQSASGKKL